MKRKGFTLIELLAVIVVLAIIALIATPIVMNTIEKSKKGAAERSADNYIDAVETTVATERLEGKILEGTYTINDKGNLEGNGLTEPLEIEMNGNKPSGGTITISNGQVTTDTTMTVGDYTVAYNEDNNRYEATEKGNTTPATPQPTKTYTNGEVVYFNVTTGEKCSNYTGTQSNTGVKSGCMKFYAFNDDGRDTVNLILDHNTTATVAWKKSESNLIAINSDGPKELLDQLKSDTSSWQGTETPTNYTMDQSTQGSKAKYTIDYSGYKARLITANEVATITGNTTWDEKTANSHYYFDSKTTSQSSTCKSGNTTGCKYGWLYDRTSKNCTTYGCLNNSNQTTNGYWTVSSFANDNNVACGIAGSGGVGKVNIDLSNICGVRPVITVLRSKLS